MLLPVNFFSVCYTEKETPMPYMQLVYASAATTRFSEDELIDLLGVSRKNNAELNVTGMLLFQDGSFLQVLEGDQEKVERLYKKIEQDRRHGSVVLLLRRDVDERGFGDWSMGYVNVDAKRIGLEGLFDVIRSKPFAELEGDHMRVRAILDGFQQGKWRRSIT